jgi:TolB-like protein
MKYSSRFVVFIIFSIWLSSCSNFNCTRLEKYLGGDVNLIHLGNKIADDLMNSAMPPLMPRHSEEAVLTSTFVNIHNLGQTSRMGRLLQSHVGTRLVQLGYSVKEINLRNTMRIKQGDGETILSRDLSQINSDIPVQAILTGTYSVDNRTLYITAKLVNPVNKNIISAQSYRFCMGDNLLSMFGLQRRQNDSDTVNPPSRSLINEIFF